MFNFYHKTRTNSMESTCHSFGVEDKLGATRAINIAPLTGLANVHNRGQSSVPFGAKFR